MKSSMVRIIALVIITTVQILTLSTIMTFAHSEDKTVQNIDESVSEEITAEDNGSLTGNEECELRCVISSKKVAVNERIELGFDSLGIVDYYYIAKGVNVVEKTDAPMHFELIATDEFGSIDVYADYGDGEFVKGSVYTYKYGDMVYVSEISKDHAWHKCMNEQLETNLITKEEWEDAYSNFTRTLIREDKVEREESLIEIDTINSGGVSTMTASSATTVTGRLRWEISTTGVRLPMKATRIELRDKQAVGSRLIAEGFTDVNGYFTFTLDNSEWNSLESDGLDVFIRWHLESETFRITQEWLISSISGILGIEDVVGIADLTGYYFDGNVVENVVSGTTTEFYKYVPYDESYSINKATYVQQCMVIGQRFAQAMGMSTTNFIHVAYPTIGEVMKDTGFCYGDINGQYYSFIGTSNFNRVDTILHEYGHFVEGCKGTYDISLWDFVLWNPQHWFDTDHFEDKDNKSFAMKLTWTESWATAFSLIAQEYYRSEYSSLAYYGDFKYEGINYSLETETTDKNSCEAQEKAVTMLLWDLFDNEETVSDSTESFDNIALGYQLWWYVTARSGTYTLTDFVNVVENLYSTYREGVAEIMSNYQISPGYFYVRNSSSVSASTPPKLSWRVNGSINNPNDRFQVVFYNNYGQLIHACSPITVTAAYNTSYTYDVSASDWNKVLKNYGGEFTIKVAVRGYHTEEPMSGPYTSKFDLITLTVNKSLSVSANNRYTESVVKLDKGGYCDYTVTFATAGYKLIQTFGTRATTVELYSASGSLLKSDDSSGYNSNSLIKYYCSAGTTYVIRVKYWGAATYGETKLAITPANGVLKSGVSDINTYESILEVSAQTYSLASNAQKDYTKLLVYRPSSAGSYTFTIESDFDTYIYVIDPRSTELVASGTNYDDDSGANLNPLLTTTLDARISYLVIFSAYNPNTLTSTKNLTVKINKN